MCRAGDSQQVVPFRGRSGVRGSRRVATLVA